MNKLAFQSNDPLNHLPRVLDGLRKKGGRIVALDIKTVDAEWTTCDLGFEHLAKEAGLPTGIKFGADFSIPAMN